MISNGNYERKHQIDVPHAGCRRLGVINPTHKTSDKRMLTDIHTINSVERRRQLRTLMVRYAFPLLNNSAKKFNTGPIPEGDKGS